MRQPLPRSFTRSTAAAVALFLCLLLASPPMLAEENNLEAQLRLNNEAADAARAGQFERAILLLRSSLELGELNITWLNLGRTYARAGQCVAAADAYGRVAGSPAVPEPAAAELEALAGRYLGELDTGCYATVTFDCRPERIELAIDGGEFTACTRKALPLEPGTHAVIARLGTQVIETTVEVARGERTRATVVMPEDGGGQVEVAPVPPPPEPSAWERPLWWGVGVSSLGAIALGAALVVDQVVLSDEIDTLEALGSSGDADAFDRQRDTVEGLQALSLGLFIGGGALLAGGVALVIVDLVLYGESDVARDASPVVQLGPEGASFGWAVRF